MVQSSAEGDEVRSTMKNIGERVWAWLAARPKENVGTRG